MVKRYMPWSRTTFDAWAGVEVRVVVELKKEAQVLIKVEKYVPWSTRI